jgi:hypothetical protein
MTPEHYDMEIQPITYIMANGLGFCEGNIVKYVSRYGLKGGIDDLKKARHYLNMLIDSFEKQIPELISTSPSDDSMAIYESLKDQLIRCRESK